MILVKQTNKNSAQGKKNLKPFQNYIQKYNYTLKLNMPLIVDT